ncbi:MAG TPA: Npt1/Npt2 family nucleotide transporter, partial [Byssovorax sp.]
MPSLTNLLTRFVDVRPGEGRALAGAFFVCFGIVGGHTILETARDAMFLSKLPPTQLTFVYAGVALGTIALSNWNARFVQRFGQRNALIVTLVLGAFVTTILHFREMTPAVLYGFYGFSALIGAVLGAQFWMFAAQLFTVTQGRRLFAAIASGGVVGAVAGASVAAALLPFVHTRALLLASASVFLTTAMLTTTLPRGDASATTTGSMTDDAALSGGSVAPPAGVDRDAPDDDPGLFTLLRRVPYLRRLAVFTGLGTASVLVVDFLFKSTAHDVIPKEHLATFFARTYAVLNVVSLLVQVLVAARVLRRLGVVAALVVLPLLLAGGTLGMFFFGGLLSLSLFTKGADGGLRYSIQRVATELLWMPLKRGVQVRAKALIDTAFGKVVQAVVAAGLYALVVLQPRGLPRLLALVAFALSALWIASVLMLRSSYVDLFRQALSRGAIDVPVFAQELDVASVEAVLEALSSRQPERVIAAMEVLHEQRRDRLVPALILYHESEVVLVRALATIAAPSRHDWPPLAERLLDHASPVVRVAALRALVSAGYKDAVRRAADDPSAVVRAHAALLGADSDDDLAAAVRALLGAHGERGDEATSALFDAIAERPDPRFADVMLELSQGASNEVAAHAARAMSRIADPRFVPWLVGRLKVREGRDDVRQALVKQDEVAFDALVAAFEDPRTHDKLRVHIPRTMSRFGTQRAADVLLDVVLGDDRGLVRYKALRGL